MSPATKGAQMAVRCGKGHGYHRDSNAVRACYAGATVELVTDGEPADDTGYDPVASAARSRYRDDMREQNGPLAPPVGSTRWIEANIKEGFYAMRLDPRSNEWEVFKVQRAVHGSGLLYAKRLNHDTGKWDYERGAVKRLRPEHNMELKEALEVAKQTGLNPNSQLFGHCFVCGLPLTKEESMERGMGDVCAGKFA